MSNVIPEINIRISRRRISIFTNVIRPFKIVFKLTWSLTNIFHTFIFSPIGGLIKLFSTATNDKYSKPY